MTELLTQIKWLPSIFPNSDGLIKKVTMVKLDTAIFCD